MDWVEKIPDPNKKKLESSVLEKLSEIIQQHEPPKPSVPKTLLKSIDFEDAIKELLNLCKNKN